MPIAIISIEIIRTLFIQSLLEICFWGGKCDRFNLEDLGQKSKAQKCKDLQGSDEIFLGRYSIVLISLISQINHINTGIEIPKCSLGGCYRKKTFFHSFTHALSMLRSPKGFFRRSERAGIWMECWKSLGQ